MNLLFFYFVDQRVDTAPTWTNRTGKKENNNESIHCKKKIHWRVHFLLNIFMRRFCFCSLFLLFSLFSFCCVLVYLVFNNNEWRERNKIALCIACYQRFVLEVRWLWVFATLTTPSMRLWAIYYVYASIVALY